MIAQDVLAGINPVYWQFWIGLLLVVMVLFARGGVMGALSALAGRARRANPENTTGTVAGRGARTGGDA